MKRVKYSDIRFKVNPKLVYVKNFTMRFYTVSSRFYFFEKTEQDVIEVEREATVDDVDVILSGGTKVTEYYIPIEWDELLYVGEGVLNYRVTNNIEDPEFPDHYYNKEITVTTDFYIDCDIHVDPEPAEGLIERIVALEEHLATEIVDRETADSFISGAVDTEIARAISAETELSEALTSETSRAISAETVLDEKIDAETNRATSAETALNEALQAESNRAISAETALDAKIDQEIQDRKDDVDAEETRAINAESALTDTINAETNRAISAETELSNAITNETNRATSAETALNEALTDEVNRATSAETTLDEKIVAETNRAISAETALNEALQAETNRATSAETALNDKIEVVSGNVISETSRATTAENALSGAIDSVSAITSGDVETLTQAIANEVSRATSAETEINTIIEDNELITSQALNYINARLDDSYTELDERVDQEIADRIADVNTEEARAISAETALDVKIDTVSGNVISETTRATTAENALSGAIDSISATTSGSVEELDAKIDQEIADRTADVDAEETRAKGVEDVLSGAIDTLDVRFFDDAKYEASGNTKVINFYNGNVVKATIDASDFIVDGMVEDVRIENGYLVIDFNTASGKQDIQIPLTDIFNPNNYYTKSETSGATEIATALAQKLNISDFNAYSAATDTLINSKASQSDLNTLNGVVTAHTANTTVHVTTSDKAKWNKVDDKLDVTDFNTYSASTDSRIAEDEEVTAAALNQLNESLIEIVNYINLLKNNNIDKFTAQYDSATDTWYLSGGEY